MLASLIRSRLSLTVFIGEIISESRDNEYVTAGIGRPSAVDRKIGSRSVLCEQMNRTPDWPIDFFGGGGGVPLTFTRTPSAQNA